MTKDNILIRRAERQDVPLLLDFIRGIARYEKMENEVIASPEVLEREMFDEHRAEAVFAVVDGREVGFALYFYNFSTFIGHSGLYLEDLFVWPEERGKGYGKALLLHLVRIAHEHHCGRMEWTCLNWNQPSIDFYLSLGAVPMNEWTIYRLDATALERLSKLKDGMNIEDYREYCLSLGEDVEEKLPFTAFHHASGVLVFYVHGHMFSFFDCDDFSIITLKCQPERIEELKAQYSFIGKPYNESPKYWIGIDVNTAPDDILRELTRNSYEIVKAKYKKHG